VQSTIHPAATGGFEPQEHEPTSIMPIRIKLKEEDQPLLIRVDADEWGKAYKRALDNHTMVEVHEDGRTLAINPRQILFWEEIREEESDQGAVRQAQPA
jgi:hypothetical protein